MKEIVLHLKLCKFGKRTTKQFAVYFEKFLNESNKWAYCHRLNAGISTNMALGYLHRNLKYIYLKGRKVNRAKIPHKLSELRNRHRTAETIATDTVFLLGENKWKVMSSSGN